jgi:CRISPR-associated protein Csd1
VGKLRDNLRKHLEDISIEGPRDYPPSIWAIINETLKKKGDEETGRMKIIEKMDSSPVQKLAGDLTRSIIENVPYPSGLLCSMLDRIRKDNVVSFSRVSMIKGFLARNFVTYLEKNKINKEALMSLDTKCKEEGYVLGRLFAAYEKAQLYYHWKESGRQPNRTIKDSYYSIASTNPLIAFTTLERLAKVHLTKAGWLRPEIEAIENLLDAKPYPTTLSLPQQSLFILGYYHQSWAFRSDAQKEEIDKTQTTEE